MRKLYLTTAAILLAVPAAFATSDVEVVTVIKTENGPVRIPASQFNAAEHTLHVADEHHDEHGVARRLAGNNPGPQPVAITADIGTVTAGTLAPVAIDADTSGVGVASSAPPKQYGVLQNKGKFYIVNSADGTPVSDNAAVDPKGYPNNPEAWGVLMNLQTPPPATS